MATASYELFDPYPVTGEEIREAAEQSSTSAEALETLEGEVDREHRPAVDAAEGDITPHIQTAPMPAQQQSQAVREKVNFAKGALNLFAIAVDDFNMNSSDPRSVSKLNQAYREAMNSSFGLNHDDYEDGGSKENRDYSADWQSASQSLIGTLRTEYGRLETNLDGEAETVSGMLSRGPNADDIRAMFRAGALPINADTMFPNVNFTRDDWEAYLIERAGNGDLPDMRFIPDEYRDSLLGDENVMAAVRDGLQVDGDWGSIDGNVLATGNQDDLWRVGNNLAWVTAYATFSQKYNEEHPGSTEFDLTSDMKDYLNNLYETSVGDNPVQTMEMLDNLGLSDYGGENETFRRNFANGIMALSNEDLGGGWNSLPTNVQNLLNIQIGSAEWRGEPDDPSGYVYPQDLANLPGLDQFKALSDLLSPSTLEGGDDFSYKLAETAIEARQDLNYNVDWHRMHFGGPGMNTPNEEELQAYADMLGRDGDFSNLLSITARNEDASAELLLNNETREELLGLNWYDEDGAADIITSGTDRDPENGGGTEHQTDAALAVMQEVGSAPNDYLSRMGEGVEDAVTDVGITYVDTFGRAFINESTTDANGITMSGGDARDFLQFVVGTGTQDAARFEGASITYQTNLISAAMNADSPEELQRIADALGVDPDVLNEGNAVHLTLQSAGQADGIIQKANFEYLVDKAEDADAAAQLAADRRNAALRVATAVIGVGTTAGGAIWKPAAPFLSSGNAIVGQILGSFIDNPDPTAHHVREENYDLDQMNSSNRRNWYLLQAMDQAGMEVPAHLLDYDTLMSQPGNPTEAEALVNDTFGTGQETFDTRRDDVYNGSHFDNDRNDSGWSDHRGDDAMRNLYNRPDLMWSADPEWFREHWSTYDHEGTYGSDGEQRR